MYKRLTAIVLAVLFALTLTGCKLIESIFPKNEQAGVNDVNPNNVNLEDYSDYGDVSDFWVHLYEQWKEEENNELGYVWTITIDEATVIDALGLTKVTYDLDLSCSHIGEDMFGVYRGSMAMSYDADVSGVNQLFALLGGKSQSDTKGWFRNDRFVMELTDYNAEKEHGFISTLEPYDEENDEMSQQEAYAAIGDALVALMANKDKEFETTSSPKAYWFDWDYHMTSGDMSSYYSVSGFFSGVTYNAEGSMDSSGGHISSHGTATVPYIAMTFSERYSDDFESPFPYIIRVYETGEVVFELHSATGGPVVVKFYGTIDKIPVEDTIAVH